MRLPLPKFLKKMKFAAYSLALLTLLQSCSQNNVKQDKNLKKYFDENKVEGCFALMDNGTGKFTVHNLGRYRDSSYLPASTFKIVNSLIGLQTGKISSDSMVIKWDGVKRLVELEEIRCSFGWILWVMVQKELTAQLILSGWIIP